MSTTTEQKYLPNATIIDEGDYSRDRHIELLAKPDHGAQIVVVFHEDAGFTPTGRAFGENLHEPAVRQLRDELNKILNENATTVDPEERQILGAEISSLRSELAIKQDLLDAAIREKDTAARQAVAAREQQFVSEVIDYHDGCMAGKRDFLETIGLEWPTITITYTITVEGPQLDDNEDYRYSDDLQRAADEVGYYWEGASVVNRDWEYS